MTPATALTAASSRLKTLKQKIMDWANQIRDPLLKDVVFHHLRYAAPAFWTMPASRTRRHHPPDERQDGGLLIHILRLLSMTDEAVEWLRAAGYTARHWRDWWIAACILHDLLRATERYRKQHAAEMAKRLSERLDSRYRPLIEAVERHDGPWGNSLPKHPFALLFHMADFWLTRTGIITAEV